MAAEDENKRTKERCKRFTERVNVNITEAGKLAQHMIKASGSTDVRRNHCLKPVVISRFQGRNFSYSLKLTSKLLL